MALFDFQSTSEMKFSSLQIVSDNSQLYMSGCPWSERLIQEDNTNSYDPVKGNHHCLLELTVK